MQMMDIITIKKSDWNDTENNILRFIFHYFSG